MTTVGDVKDAWGSLTLRLYRERYEQYGYVGLVDKRRQSPSVQRVAAPEVEHIPAHSPQARARSERVNRTRQDRLVNELRVAGGTTLEAANACLRDVFIPRDKETLSRPPRDPESAWVAVNDADLEQILCHEESRVVGPDNVVALGTIALQIAKQPGRRTCAGLTVTVRRYLTGEYAIWRGAQRLGRYDATGRPMDAAALVDVGRSRTPFRAGQVDEGTSRHHEARRQEPA
jgi:hypothetical protein